MKKLIKKVLFDKKEKIPTQDHIAILIARLCDPTDPVYDADFAAEMQKEYENRTTK